MGQLISAPHDADRELGAYALFFVDSPPRQPEALIQGFRSSVATYFWAKAAKSKQKQLVKNL
jgi:hypothetical protein